jgi:hypothetical protein
MVRARTGTERKHIPGKKGNTLPMACDDVLLYWLDFLWVILPRRHQSSARMCSIGRSVDGWMMIWKWFGRQSSWANRGTVPVFGPEVTTKDLSRDSRCPSQHSNPEPAKYNFKALLLDEPVPKDALNCIYFSLKMKTSYRCPASIRKHHSWKANSSSATQEIPRLLWNSKVHYSFHNSLSLVPTLTHRNHVNIFKFIYSKIYFNIILLPTRRCPT